MPEDHACADPLTHHVCDLTTHHVCDLTAVVESINASYPGLEAFAASVRAGDLNTACEELVTYYKTNTKSVSACACACGRA